MSVLYYNWVAILLHTTSLRSSFFPQGRETPVDKAGVVKWLIVDPFNGIFIHLLTHLCMSWFLADSVLHTPLLVITDLKWVEIHKMLSKTCRDWFWSKFCKHSECPKLRLFFCFLVSYIHITDLKYKRCPINTSARTMERERLEDNENDIQMKRDYFYRFPFGDSLLGW